MGVSTRTASRSPEISVDEIGGHGRAVSPGGTSGAIAGMLGARNTSHLRDIFLVARPEFAVSLSDCPCIERASSARIGQVEAVTRPIPRASDRNSRLEVMMTLSDRIFVLLFYSNRGRQCRRSGRPSDPTKQPPGLSIRSELCRRQRTVRYP